VAQFLNDNEETLMSKKILAAGAAFVICSTSANAQPQQNPKPPRQAGASAAHSDTQGWTPGAPLPPSRKANTHRPASGAGKSSFFHKKQKPASAVDAN